ncbi:3Beta-HSD domain-containing protein [Favolaschia claudopus]|uniref:3Beta-HSD domain-containing protein n=1 Tax=Favolaschia claudopus TaxID=2862362 RepID=A0AAW0DN87_9AGAR
MSTQRTNESYLVVGGGTATGEAIASQLLYRGERRVSIFDGVPLAPEQTKRFGSGLNAIFVGNILELKSVVDAVKASAATCIIHVGAITTAEASAAVYPTQRPPNLTPEQREKFLADHMAFHKQVNMEGTRNLLSAALEDSTVTQLVYIGSADIVFNGKERPMLREVDAPYPDNCLKSLEPQQHAERMVLSFNGVNALRTAVIRPAMPFGPSVGSAAILRRFQAAPQFAGIQLGDNTNLADRTYVANTAHAAILAADRLAPAHPQHELVAGRAFFITNDDPRPFWDFYRALWVAIGGAEPKKVVADQTFMSVMAGVKDFVAKVKREKSPNAQMKIKCMSATRTYDISLAKEVLGYKPIVSYDEGIRQVAEWWLEQQLRLCKEQGSNVPPPYSYNEAVFFAEKSPFF